MTNQDLMKAVYDYCRKSGDYSHILFQVPFISGKIDMLLMDNSRGLHAVSFASTNWRTAVRNAREASLGVEKSYVCIPEPLWKKMSTTVSFEQQGLGLFLVSPTTFTAKVQVSAGQSPTPLVSYRASVLRGVAERLSAATQEPSSTCR